MVYVMSIDAPTISKLATVPPDVSRNRRHSGPAGHPGQVVYQRNCQACHGEDLAGFGSMPSLTGIAKRMNASVIRGIVLNGKGQMPAFANLTDSEVSALCAFLTGDGSAQSAHGGQAVASRTTQKTARPRRGPVVASGGAPAGQLAPGAKLPPVSPYGIYAGPPYPKNVAAPTVRYYNNYSTDFASIGPPWSTITAYDLNRATIRWQVPLGDDVRGLAEGAKNTGSRQARVGMVVTSAGLLFAAGNDGKVRAYDTDNGRVLWSGAIPGGSRGIPAMYQVNGRQYLVVCATYDLPVHATSERLMQRIRNLAHLNAPKGYIVFALPDKFR